MKAGGAEEKPGARDDGGGAEGKINRRRRMRRRRRAKEGQEKRKRENQQPILKKLCAALLRSFREQHSEKMKGSARGNWDPREGQHPFRPNPNGAGDRTTTLRRLLIGAEIFFFAQRVFRKW